MTKKSQTRQLSDRLTKDKKKTIQDLTEIHANTTGLLRTGADLFDMLKNPELQDNIVNKKRVTELIPVLSNDIFALREQTSKLAEKSAQILSKMRLRRDDAMEVIQVFEGYAAITQQYTNAVAPVQAEILEAIDEAAGIALAKKQALAEKAQADAAVEADPSVIQTTVTEVSETV